MLMTSIVGILLSLMVGFIFGITHVTETYGDIYAILFILGASLLIGIIGLKFKLILYFLGVELE